MSHSGMKAKTSNSKMTKSPVVDKTRGKSRERDTKKDVASSGAKNRASMSPGKEKDKEKTKLWLNNVSLDAPAIDFSYKELKELNDIRYEDPRTGKRKPKQTREDEESKDKDAKGKKRDGFKGFGGEDEGTGTDRRGDGEKGEEGKERGDNEDGDKNEENGENQPEKVEKPAAGKEDEAKAKEKKVADAIKIIPTSTISSLIASNNIPLSNAAGGQQGKGALQEINKHIQTKKFSVKLISTTLLLSYNKFRHLNKMYDIIDSVLYDPMHLQWIDLSHNYLVNLTDDITRFKNLKTLYLHCNYINDLQEIGKLRPLEQLRTLTIHGNPVETISGFRMYIIGTIPSLIRLDSVLISKKERDNTNVMFNYFHLNQLPAAEKPTRPPEVVVADTKNGGESKN